jgi:hypothetical protein
MSNRPYSPEFKDEAIRQVVKRGYRVPIEAAGDSGGPEIEGLLLFQRNELVEVYLCGMVQE